jgi:hypothetical protein
MRAKHLTLAGAGIILAALVTAAALEWASDYVASAVFGMPAP